MSLNYLIFAKCLEIFELKVLSRGTQVQCDHNWNADLMLASPHPPLPCPLMAWLLPRCWGSRPQTQAHIPGAACVCFCSWVEAGLQCGELASSRLHPVRAPAVQGAALPKHHAWTPSWALPHPSQMVQPRFIHAFRKMPIFMRPCLW